jgi:hypothetical protein
VTLPIGAVTVMIGPPGGTVKIQGPQGWIELIIPPGCFTQLETVTLSLPSGYAANASAASHIIAATGVGVDIGLVPYVMPLKEPELRMAYRQARVGSMTPGQFIIARYDEGRGVWVPYASEVDEATQWVAAMINHFSTFQIVQSVPSGTVATLRAFPNPLRPSQGELFMTLSMLPANARVRIYTLTGLLVRDLSADAGGVARWDGINQSGAEAASGVYFVLAQGSGQTETFKVAIER